MKRSVADVRQSLERVRGGDESEGELDREGMEADGSKIEECGEEEDELEEREEV